MVRTPGAIMHHVSGPSTPLTAIPKQWQHAGTHQTNQHFLCTAHLLSLSRMALTASERGHLHSKLQCLCNFCPL